MENRISSAGGDGKTSGGYLSPLMMWAMAFGCAVGWGSFVMPGTAFLPVAGPVGTAIGMAIGAVIMLVIGLNYSYLMQRNGDAGGAYGFVKRLCNYDHGYLCAWFLILSYTAIVWGNVTALSLIRRYFLDSLPGGFCYNIAGYDVYLGEIAIALVVLIVAGIVLCRSKKLVPVVLNTMFAVVLFGGIAVVFGAVVKHCGGDISAIEPAFNPASDKSPVLQVIGVVALTPWAFIGFESISHCVEELRFPVGKTTKIIVVTLITVVLAYTMLAFMAAAIPAEGFSNWSEHIAELDYLDGLESLPVFNAAKTAMGGFGLGILCLAFLAAILTAVIGYIFTASRLVYSMARDGILPKWLGKLNKNANPSNAQIAIVAVSCAVIFLGRTTIGWVIDVTTIGASIVYGYVSYCAYVQARHEGRRLRMAVGIAGLVTAIAIALYFLLPNFWSITAFANESYMMLAAWSVLGFFFFRRVFRDDMSGHFGRSTIVWLALLMLIFFASLMWMRQGTHATVSKAVDETVECFNLITGGERFDSEELAFIESKDNAVGEAITRYNVVQMLVMVVALTIMLNIFAIMSKREKQAAKAKSYFFSTVSHDIRTPLNAIVGFSQMLKLGFSSKEEQNKAVDSIVTCSNTLLRLINDVLDLSKLEAGRMEIKPEPTDVNRLMEEMVEMFKIANIKKNIDIRCKVEGLPMLEVDPNRIRQLAFNLIGNAVKFTETGFVEVRARFESSGEDIPGTFTFEVQDTGGGISEEDQKKIASPYVQVGSKLARHGGTGLGLAICRQLADAMGGEMTFVSALGKGSTFTISIRGVMAVKPVEGEEPSVPQTPAPADAPSPSAAPAQAPSAPKAEEPAPAAAPSVPAVAVAATSGNAPVKPRILIVDDSKMNLLVLKALLGRMGITDITMAADGKEAFDKLSEVGTKDYDMVLTDMWMPVTDGEGLARAIRANDKLSNLPVYVVTADVELQRTYAEKGFTDILLKPVTLDMLKQFIAT